MARVVCTLQVGELDGGVLCSRVVEPQSWLEDLGKGSYMCALVLHMACGWEAPAGFLTGLNRCVPRIWKHNPIIYIVVNET